MEKTEKPGELQISTMVDADLRTKFDQARLDRGRINLKDGVSAAIALWLEGQNVESADFGKLSGEEYRYVQTLLRVLREREPRGLYQAFVGGLEAELLQHPVESPHERKKRKIGGDQRTG